MTPHEILDGFLSLLKEEHPQTQEDVWDILRQGLSVEGYRMPRINLLPKRENFMAFNPNVSMPKLAEIAYLAEELDWETNGGLGHQLAKAIEAFEPVIQARELEYAQQLADWPKSKKTPVLGEQVQVEVAAFNAATSILNFFNRMHRREKQKDELMKWLLNALEQNYELAFELAHQQKVNLNLLKRLRELRVSTIDPGADSVAA